MPNQVALPIDLYTPIFAVSRISGWTAHVLEQYEDKGKVREAVIYIAAGSIITGLLGLGAGLGAALRGDGWEVVTSVEYPGYGLCGWCGVRTPKSSISPTVNAMLPESSNPKVPTSSRSACSRAAAACSPVRAAKRLADMLVLHHHDHGLRLQGRAIRRTRKLYSV